MPRSLHISFQSSFWNSPPKSVRIWKRVSSFKRTSRTKAWAALQSSFVTQWHCYDKTSKRVTCRQDISISLRTNMRTSKINTKNFHRGSSKLRFQAWADALDEIRYKVYSRHNTTWYPSSSSPNTLVFVPGPMFSHIRSAQSTVHAPSLRTHDVRTSARATGNTGMYRLDVQISGRLIRKTKPESPIAPSNF